MNMPAFVNRLLARLPLGQGDESAVLQDRLNVLSRKTLVRLGWPGIVAIGIFAMCIPFYFTAILPLQERMRDAELMEQQSLVADSRQDAFRNAKTPQDELALFYQYFPEEKTSPRWLGKLVEIAGKNGLSLNHGDYGVNRERSGRLVRFHISLPLQGRYTQVRHFLADVNAELPMIALENVQFERKDIYDTSLQVKLKLLLYLVQS